MEPISGPAWGLFWSHIGNSIPVRPPLHHFGPGNTNFSPQSAILGLKMAIFAPKSANLALKLAISHLKVPFLHQKSVKMVVPKRVSPQGPKRGSQKRGPQKGVPKRGSPKGVPKIFPQKGVPQKEVPKRGSQKGVPKKGIPKRASPTRCSQKVVSKGGLKRGSPKGGPLTQGPGCKPPTSGRSPPEEATSIFFLLTPDVGHQEKKNSLLTPLVSAWGKRRAGKTK